MYIPPTHQNVMVYLILKDARGFANFTEQIFSSTLLTSHERDGSDVIMHGEIVIGTSTIMFAEATDQFQVQSSHFFIYVDDVDQTYQLIINNGGKAVTEVGDQPYGRSGGVLDPFGNTWWVTTMLEK